MSNNTEDRPRKRLWRRFVLLFSLMLLLVISSLVLLRFSSGKYKQPVERVKVAADLIRNVRDTMPLQAYYLAVERESLANSTLPALLSAAGDLTERLLTDSVDADSISLARAADRTFNSLSRYVGRLLDAVRQGAATEVRDEMVENINSTGEVLIDFVNQYILNELDILASTNRLVSKLTLTSILLIALFSAALLFFTAKALQDYQKESEAVRLTEFRLLQEQIKPHFLYNTLELILFEAESGKPDSVIDVVENLSSFFRLSLSQGQPIVSVRNEVDHIRHYLAIQQRRYEDVLEFDIQAHADALELNMPKLTLQPIVENAIYHGIKPKRAKGFILVKVYTDEDALHLTVLDNGIGMDGELLAEVNRRLKKKTMPKRGIGLANIQQRLQLLYGDQYGIGIESQPGEGTLVEVRLPLSIKKQ